MDDETHVKAFPCRYKFWDSLKISDLLPSICESLKRMYQATYMAFSKTKDKQMQFILQWYQQCSKMLLEEKLVHGLSDTTSKWIDFRNSHQPQCTLFHSNSVMIAVQVAVFDYSQRLLTVNCWLQLVLLVNGLVLNCHQNQMTCTTVLEVLEQLYYCLAESRVYYCIQNM